ncbi:MULTISPECIES: hypothetical protein [Methylobacterium]|jgi:hypothetical protein|uniref:Uncharacterized protein n=1 Tax=Methylobacterium longum TaxID=767694 RepID=A0ABT8AL92_9HYPH|nr:MULTISPECIES: hypothetical protein [Methylobacterium]MCJ2098535.1 hypothetical protein [Methylobacterium sp. E-046]MDN3570341.1 hypothetical protein [Methylobacterium longum]GJE11338.1 hypothetical protein FOHLNKBM_2380 [Methylobacterium longum]
MSRVWIPPSAALMLLIGASGAFAMPMGGSFTLHYDGQNMQPIAPGKMRIEERGTGINKSPGQPLDNAQVTIVETVTMESGQGPLKGTITFTTPNGTTTSPYTGRVTTDALGRVTAVGAFKVAKATGAFAGLKGTGSFTAVFASPTDQTTQWQGEFKPPPALASTR